MVLPQRNRTDGQVVAARVETEVLVGVLQKLGQQLLGLRRRGDQVAELKIVDGDVFPVKVEANLAVIRLICFHERRTVLSRLRVFAVSADSIVKSACYACS